MFQVDASRIRDAVVCDMKRRHLPRDTAVVADQLLSLQVLHSVLVPDVSLCVRQVKSGSINSRIRLSPENWPARVRGSASTGDGAKLCFYPSASEGYAQY